MDMREAHEKEAGAAQHHDRGPARGATHARAVSGGRGAGTPAAAAGAGAAAERRASASARRVRRRARHGGRRRPQGARAAQAQRSGRRCRAPRARRRRARPTGRSPQSPAGSASPVTSSHTASARNAQPSARIVGHQRASASVGARASARTRARRPARGGSRRLAAAPSARTGGHRSASGALSSGPRVAHGCLLGNLGLVWIGRRGVSRGTPGRPCSSAPAAPRSVVASHSLWHGGLRPRRGQGARLARASGGFRAGSRRARGGAVAGRPPAGAAPAAGVCGAKTTRRRDGGTVQGMQGAKAPAWPRSDPGP